MRARVSGQHSELQDSQEYIDEVGEGGKKRRRERRGGRKRWERGGGGSRREIVSALEMNLELHLC